MLVFLCVIFALETLMTYRGDLNSFAATLLWMMPQHEKMKNEEKEREREICSIRCFPICCYFNTYQELQDVISKPFITIRVM